YAGVVFVLAPLAIATGAAMSPALAARFPGYTRLFGGRQAARSIHFLCMVAFLAFTVGHVAMVVVHGLPEGAAHIVLGGEDRRDSRLPSGGSGCWRSSRCTSRARSPRCAGLARW